MILSSVCQIGRPDRPSGPGVQPGAGEGDSDA
jgi:hypothetical protein